MFIELGYMHTNGATLSYGGESRPPHSHLPGHEALKLAGDTFKNAPVSNPMKPERHRVHFDAGANYPACDTTATPAPPCADEYLDPHRDGNHHSAGTPGAPAANACVGSVATGGERMNEMSTVCQRPEW